MSYLPAIFIPVAGCISMAVLQVFPGSFLEMAGMHVMVMNFLSSRFGDRGIASQAIKLLLAFPELQTITFR